MEKENKVQIIMPMCGEGSRFLKSGIKIPKPLVQINGKPFFYWSAISAIRIFPDYYSLVFIVLKKHVIEYKIDKEIYNFFPNSKIVILDKVLNGPIYTCLQVEKYILNSLPIVFNDCDHAFLLDGFRKFNINNSLFCFRSSNKNYSYALLKNGFVSRIAEKKVISNFAICGVYLFDNFMTFKEYAIMVINSTYGEKYMSYIYDFLCKDRKLSIVQLDEHISFGTPEEYNVALKSDIFRKLEND